MVADNGKIRIEIRDGVPILDIYHNGELQVADVVWANQTLLHDIEPPLQLPTNLIIDRTGSYSLSSEAYILMQEIMKESKLVAYITYSSTQNSMVDLAKNTYLADKKVAQFNSIDAAFKWFKENR